MAEIEIERRPRRSPWTWVALLLVLVAVAVGAWLVFGDGAESGEGYPAAETTTEEPFGEPAQPVDAPLLPQEGEGDGQPVPDGAAGEGAGPHVDPGEGVDPAR